MNFAWLSDLFDAILSLFPRLIIIRATHGGIKWVRGHKVVELKPGIHMYWPLVTELDRIVVARQTYKIPKPQAITTKDDISIAVGALVVYLINDVTKAIGKQNWDCETTLADVTESAVFHVINKYDYGYILDNLSDIESELTETCKKELYKYGLLIQQARFTDFAKTEVKMFFGLTNESVITED